MTQSIRYFWFVMALILLTTFVMTPDWVLGTFLVWLGVAATAITGYEAFSPHWADFARMFYSGVVEGEVVDPSVREIAPTLSDTEEGHGPAEGSSVSGAVG